MEHIDFTQYIINVVFFYLTISYFLILDIKHDTVNLGMFRNTDKWNIAYSKNKLKVIY